MADIRLTLHLPKIPILSAAQARQVLQQEIGRGVFELTELIADHARRTVKVDRGILRGSIFTEVDLGQGPVLVKGLVATGAQAPYAPFVEYGTRPHWAPIAPLKAWARRVLGNERAGYAIQKAIARRGTRAAPFMGPALEAGRQRAPVIIAASAARAAQRLEGNR